MQCPLKVLLKMCPFFCKCWCRSLPKFIEENSCCILLLEGDSVWAAHRFKLTSCCFNYGSEVWFNRQNTSVVVELSLFLPHQKNLLLVAGVVKLYSHLERLSRWLWSFTTPATSRCCKCASCQYYDFGLSSLFWRTSTLGNQDLKNWVGCLPSAPSSNPTICVFSLLLWFSWSSIHSSIIFTDRCREAT